MQLEPRATDEIEAVLRPDETLLWAGAPARGLKLGSQDLILIPFSLLWGGFALFWEAAAISMDAPLLMKLFGIPFVVIGLYIMVGRFFVDARRRSTTAYALTDRRAIIASGLHSRSIESFDVQGLTSTSLKQRRDGSGTVLLRAPVAGTRRGPSFAGVDAGIPAFRHIQEAAAVYELLQELCKKSSPAA